MGHPRIRSDDKGARAHTGERVLARRADCATRGRRSAGRAAAPYFFSSCLLSASPAPCTTFCRNSYCVWTSPSAISMAASTISRRLDGRSPRAGRFSSTVSTNLRTASIAARWPDWTDLSTSSESSAVRSTGLAFAFALGFTARLRGPAPFGGGARAATRRSAARPPPPRPDVPLNDGPRPHELVTGGPPEPPRGEVHAPAQ